MGPNAATNAAVAAAATTVVIHKPAHAVAGISTKAAACAAAGVSADTHFGQWAHIKGATLCAAGHCMPQLCARGCWTGLGWAAQLLLAVCKEAHLAAAGGTSGAELCAVHVWMQPVLCHLNPISKMIAATAQAQS